MVELTFSRLRRYNLIIGVIQLVTGAAIFGLGPWNSLTRLPWYTFFVASWDRKNGPADFYSPVPKQVASFPIVVWSGVFLLLSALDHFVVSLPGVNAVYNRRLCRNQNPFRFAEYTVSASIMSVMIAQLCGVTDIHLLFTIAALMATTMLFGWQMEVLNGERLPTFAYAPENPRSPPEPLTHPEAAVLPFVTDARVEVTPAAAGKNTRAAHHETPRRVDWGPFIMGCWPFLAVELVSACYFFQAVANHDPPKFVWSLFFILLVLYSLFALNQVLQFKQVRWFRGFAKAELWYMILSLTSKQLLAWITYGGTRRFDDDGS